MSDHNRFETRLADVMRRYAGRAPADIDATALAHRIASGQGSGAQHDRRWWPFGRSRQDTGRTRSMLSPVTAIAAGVLVFAVGGTLFLVQPVDQPGETAPAASVDVAPDEILFSIVDEPNSGIGQFTGYGSIPPGTTSREQGMWAPPDFSFIVRIDPGAPGGDTFAIQYSGRIQTELEDDVVQATAFWSVVNGSGTGEYAGITGKGELIGITNADNDLDHTDDWGVVVFSGRLGVEAE